MHKMLFYLFLCVWMSGCAESADDGDGAANSESGLAEQAPSSTAQTSAQTTAKAGQLDARTAQMWSRSCALCHVDGNAGAPRLGNIEEWQPRLVQGEAMLLKHTVQGFNGMPPLGYCMACENEHFIAMTRFMSGSNLSGDAP